MNEPTKFNYLWKIHLIVLLKDKKNVQKLNANDTNNKYDYHLTLTVQYGTVREFPLRDWNMTLTAC